MYRKVPLGRGTQGQAWMSVSDAESASDVGKTIRGVVGRIDWGYFAAGTINGYSVHRCADGSWLLHGTLVTFDAFKIRQRPLVFVAPHKDGEWRWPVQSLDVGEGRGPREVQATLGPQLPEMISLGR